jgi:hypothetical protein
MLGLTFTFCKVLDAYVVVLIFHFHNQFLSINLDYNSGASRAPSRETELAQGILDFLRNVDCGLDIVVRLFGQ